MPTSQDDATLPQATMENLETVLRMREEAWRHRSLGEKLADMVGRFVGRGSFVLLQLLILLVWAAFNTPLIRGLPVFDPYPFNLLGVLVSFEAVVITVFVLIKQNRMSLMDERRAHLELQITLLTEKEVTKLMRIMERVTQHLGIPDAIDDEAREFTQHTEIGSVAKAVHDRVQD